MKKSISRGTGFVLAAFGFAMVFWGCSSATPTDTPGVDRLGEYILRQEGPELWTVLGFRFASTTLGDEWLILETGLTSPAGQNVEVKRENIFVLNPSGSRIQLATQEEFNQAYGSLRATLKKADVNRDPLEYFPLSREECEIRFFSKPGDSVSYDRVTLNDKRGCFGRMFFKIPGAIQAGRWVFGIDLPESEIRIPFELSE